MREIKYILYTLYIVGYTSIIWATCVFDGIKLGANNLPIGLLLGIGTTIANFILIVKYLIDNWDK